MKKFDFKIVENAKKFFIVPIAIVALAVIMLFIYGFATGDAVNVGMDFTGGYKMRVELGNKLTDETYDQYADQIVGIVEGLKDEDGKSYGIKVEKVEKVGEASDAAITIQYRNVTEEIDEKIQEELSLKLLKNVPTSVNVTDSAITVKYDYILNGNICDLIKTNLVENGVKVSGYAQSGNYDVVFNLSQPVADASAVEEYLDIPDQYAGSVSPSGYTSSTVSSELLQRALLAVAIAVVLMLIYITIRFELLSGVAAIAALAHDIIILLCGMFIFHIPFNSTIVAALITILGYCINNTIIIFDRVRENRKAMPTASPADVVNTSVKNTMNRTIFSTFTTLLMIVLVAVIGVEDIRIFALPIIFGLLAGFYSANFIAPSIWAWLSGGKANAGKSKKTKKA